MIYCTCNGTSFAVESVSALPSTETQDDDGIEKYKTSFFARFSIASISIMLQIISLLNYCISKFREANTTVSIVVTFAACDIFYIFYIFHIFHYDLRTFKSLRSCTINIQTSINLVVFQN